MRSITLWRFKGIVNREDHSALDFALPNSPEEERILTHIRSQLLSMGVNAPAAETDVFGPYSGPLGSYALEEQTQSRIAVMAALTEVVDENDGLDGEEVYYDSIDTLLSEYRRNPTQKFHVYMRWQHEMGELSSLGEAAKEIKILDLSALKGWDGSAVNLSYFSNVRELILADTAQCDEYLQAVGSLQSLAVLDLGYTQVTDAGMQYIASLHGLRSLNLTGTQVTHEKEQWLQEQLPNCEIIHDRY